MKIAVISRKNGGVSEKRKKKEGKLGEARHIREGQSISDEEANNGVVHCRENRGELHSWKCESLLNM